MYFLFCAAEFWCHGEKKKNLLILLLKAVQTLKTPLDLSSNALQRLKIKFKKPNTSTKIPLKYHK